MHGETLKYICRVLLEFRPGQGTFAKDKPNTFILK